MSISWDLGADDRRLRGVNTLNQEMERLAFWRRQREEDLKQINDRIDALNKELAKAPWPSHNSQLEANSSANPRLSIENRHYHGNKCPKPDRTALSRPPVPARDTELLNVARAPLHILREKLAQWSDQARQHDQSFNNCERSAHQMPQTIELSFNHAAERFGVLQSQHEVER
jgi:hypothetical protein